MFNRDCSKCEVYADEVKFLREETKRLTDRLVAMTNTHAYQAVTYRQPDGDFYGSETDEFIEYDPVTGQKVIRIKKQ